MMMDIMQQNMNEYLPLRDVVFNTLRQAILTGELKPGERLMEIHLADRLGVSRTPIREAIRKLELEGLVVMIPRKGAQVARITEKNLKDVLEVRRALDMLAVRLACSRMDDEYKKQLREACDEFARVVKNNNTKDITEADVRFHDIINKATGNDRLIQLVNNLAEQMYRYRLEYIKDAAYHNRLVAEHEEIYSAIMDGDEERAAKAVVLHIDNQEETIIKHLNLDA
ncbi:MAG: GntR family transcriptional regulator [Lachnospiraceae bacterium]|nr:GntR family transcriptional regulator [Lachnospiraceae bacterium]MDD6656279.1 GntR family transcriptional regulator [Lachnospiraceae bacterium]